MKLESKFNLNQSVSRISKEREKVTAPCTKCSGRGNHTLDDGELLLCRTCHGYGFTSEWKDLEWQVVGMLAIGQVRIEITNIENDGEFDNMGHYKEGNDEIIVQYMTYETGIRSGTVWPEKDLFENQHLARLECDKRNANVS